MRKSIKYLLTLIFCISSFSAAMAVDVTLTVDEGFVRPSGMDAAERNLELRFSLKSIVPKVRMISFR